MKTRLKMRETVEFYAEQGRRFLTIAEVRRPALHVRDPPTKVSKCRVAS